MKVSMMEVLQRSTVTVHGNWLPGFLADQGAVENMLLEHAYNHIDLLHSIHGLLFIGKSNINNDMSIKNNVFQDYLYISL